MAQSKHFKWGYLNAKVFKDHAGNQNQQIISCQIDTFDSLHGIWHFFGLITFIWSVFQKCVSDRQARGLWQDNCFRNLKIFVISKEIKMLSFFYMHKSGYLIKFAFPVSKILSCPQNPFQSSKSLNSWQNETWWLLANIYFLRNKLYGS